MSNKQFTRSTNFSTRSHETQQVTMRGRAPFQFWPDVVVFRRRRSEGFGDIPGPKPYKFIRCGDIYNPKSYKSIGFGDIYGPKPYIFIGLSDIYGPKPYKFIGFGDILLNCEVAQPSLSGWARPFARSPAPI